MKKRIEIDWRDLQIGDIFEEDGSQVIGLENITFKPCFVVKNELKESIIVSDDHLLAIEDIKEHSNFTDLSKVILLENSQNWITVLDLYKLYQKGEKVKTIDGILIDTIELYKNGEPQPCMCISTNTGTYTVNNFVNHNTARKLFYCMSDTLVAEDCGGPYIDAMHCKMPEGGVCLKCARKTKGGERIKLNQLVGGLISTNMSEALTQLQMKQMHIGSAEISDQQDGSRIIMGTLDAWGTSPIINDMKKAKTTEEMRDILFKGLKKAYQDAHINQDDFNIQMVAKKLTSYKKTKDGIVPINEGEKCSILSMEAIGSANNIFKVSELKSGYKNLTKPIEAHIKKDAANEILR